jgi:hypothetical protein
MSQTLLAKPNALALQMLLRWPKTKATAELRQAAALRAILAVWQ